MRSISFASRGGVWAKRRRDIAAFAPSTPGSEIRAKRAGPTRRPAILALALLLAAAQPAPPPPPEAPRAAETRQQLFLSPAGEPFRSPPDAPYPVANWFRQADTDADGRLTRAEFIADGERYFQTLDSSRNGQLEANEIDAYEAAVLSPITPRPGQRGAQGPGGPDGKPSQPMQMPATAAPRKMRPDPERPRGAGLYGVINVRHPIKAADQDMNARVTAEEWRRILNSRFAILDKQGLGYLTLDSLPPTPWQEMQPGYTVKKK